MFFDSLKKRIYDIILDNNLILKNEDKQVNLKNIINNYSFIENILRKKYLEYRRSPKKKLKTIIINVVRNIFENYDTFMKNIICRNDKIKMNKNKKIDVKSKENIEDVDKKCEKKKKTENEGESEEEIEKLNIDENANKVEKENIKAIKKNTNVSKKNENDKMSELNKKTSKKLIENKIKDKIINEEKNMFLNLISQKIKSEVNNITENRENSLIDNSSNIINCIKSNRNLRDYKGIKNIKKDLLYSIIYPYKFREDSFNTIININGVSGAGKTTLSYAIAGECDCPFFYIKLPEYIRYLSNDAKNNKIKIIFEHIKKEYNKGILCIDDIDIIFSSKEDSTDLYLFTYLLSIFDNSNIIILLLSVDKPYESILYTKIQKFISIPIPTYEDRVEMLQQISQEFSVYFDVKYTASVTYGFNRGQIYDIIKESLNLYIYNDVIKKSINTNNVEENEKDIEYKSKNFDDFYQREDILIEEKKNDDINENFYNIRTEEKIKNDNDASIMEKNINMIGKCDEEIQNNKTTNNLEKEENIFHIYSNSEYSPDIKSNNFNKTGSSINVNNNNINKEASYKRKYSSIFNYKRNVENVNEKKQKRVNINIDNDIIYESVNNIKKKMTTQNICEVPNISLDNIGSLKKIKKILECKFILPIKYANIYKHLGINKSMGILLYGPPGCGKTMLAKAISNEMKANFIAIKGPEILNKYVGESEKKVREIFSYASIYKPCLIFFDEIDSICINRANNKAALASDRVVNQLLAEMDGLSQRESVYIIATTNRPDIIDKALLRSGRFDQLIYISLPKYQGRIDILKKLSKNMPIDKDVDFSEISHLTKGYSGADLYGVLRESAFIALQECRDEIDFLNADLQTSNNVVHNDSNCDIYLSKDKNSFFISKNENVNSNNDNNTNNSIQKFKNKKVLLSTYVEDFDNFSNDNSHNKIHMQNNCKTVQNDLNYMPFNQIGKSHNVCNEIGRKNKEINKKMIEFENKETIENDLELLKEKTVMNNEINRKKNNELDNKNCNEISNLDEKEILSKNKNGEIISFNNENSILIKKNNMMYEIEDLKNEELSEKDKNNLIYEFIQKNKNILTIKQKHILSAIKTIPRSVSKKQMKYYKEISKKFK
ncbi:ATPase, putative [Plasmodium gallinaceum]|uniref:ATPase, putative n=1 Tax=Plasmodium gallinaceum TaxID=5849 RepID=A0A1J1GZI9_PLAGA|nr:ATPase, putative [Plasmodium gallinaceum]CRG97641.1 ATPase, putative [Plasmodium gallinaceum]